MLYEVITGGAEVAGGALDVGLVLAHLAVDDGEAERQVDHHVADADRQERSYNFV